MLWSAEAILCRRNCRLLHWSFVLFLAASGRGVAHAEVIGYSGDDWRLNLNAQFIAPGPHRPREDHHLYRIDFKCKAGANLPTKTVYDLIALRSVTTSHSVIISKDYVAPESSGKLKIPEKPLTLLTPYAVNGQNVSDNRAICPRVPIIVSGTQPIYVVAMVNYSTTNSPGVIVKIGYSIAKLIPALWSVFEPAMMPANVGKQLSNVGETKGPMEEILSTFNKDQSFGKGFNLEVGRYLVKTDYNEVEINVSNLQSVVLAEPSSIQESFRTQIKGAPEQIKADSVGSTCSNVASALKEAGFSEEEDIPYALVNLASRLGSKAKIIECLEATGATDAALRLGPVLWKWILAKLVLKKDDIDSIQPSSFAAAKPRIYNFIVALSRITKGDAARAEEGLSQFKLIATEKLKLVDSIDNDLGGSGDLQPSELARRLIERRYLRFGCMASIGDKNGAGISGGVASFLMIRASADADTAKTADALTVHVVFKAGLISSILAFREPSWVRTNLEANEGNCNGFKLVDSAVAGRRDSERSVKVSRASSVSGKFSSRL